MQEPPQNYQGMYSPYNQPPGQNNQPPMPGGNNYAPPQNYYPQPQAYYGQTTTQGSSRSWVFLLLGGIFLVFLAALIGVMLVFGNVAAQVTSGGTSKPATTQGWQELSSKEGRFKIVFPGTPTSQKQNVTLPNLSAITLYYWSLDTSTNNYMASYNDYPDIVLKSPTETLLNGARDGAIANTNGTLKGEKRISYGAFPGREITYTVDGNKTVVQRVFIVNKRLYQVAVGFYSGKEVAADTARYFNSFQITG